MDPINFKVGEDEYQLLPHTGFTAINLDRKVLGIIGKMAASGDMFSDDDAGAFAALSGVLSEMSDSEYRWIVENTLNRLTVVTPGKKNFSLGDMDVISEHFSKNMNLLYEVMVRVWKEEKLSPFAAAPKVTAGD